MTELQVKAAQLAEDRRHNVKTEQLTRGLNEAQIQHFQDSDTYTKEHYERSDKAGLISANASAMNAEAAVTNAGTNRMNYEMQYDIEYGWTGSEGYPKGMPLSAQKKSAELELLTLPEDSKMDAVQLERSRRQSEILKNNAESLNKTSNAVSSVLNSVFGKGGIVNTIDNLT